MNNLIHKSVLVLVLSVALSGCNLSDDDDKMPEVNNSPMAIGRDLITQTDTPIMDNLKASDPENDMLSFSVKTEPVNGTLSVMNDGSFTYTPAATFTGTDSFTFSVSDGVNSSSDATVNITIESLHLSFADYSRQAYAQLPEDSPLPVNGRTFTQDVNDPAAYDDLLANP